MKEINIFIQDELKYYLQLFHILNKIYYYFDKINIHCTEKYIYINTVIFYRLFNINFVDFNKSKKKNFINFENSQSFINTINIFNFDLNINSINDINRNLLLENNYYIKLIENISDKYIFYYSNEQHKIINYFDDLYIYNPNSEFYDEEDDLYGKWIDLKISNLTYYLKIIEKSSELHIYDIDMLYLILEIDVSHIEKKYFYYSDLYIKEDDIRMKDWEIIIIKKKI